MQTKKEPKEKFQMDHFDPTQKKGIYKGLLYESFEELYILYYLFELLGEGIVKSIERCPEFKLSDKRTLAYDEVKHLKKTTKVIQKNYPLIREHIYTPDFRVVFNVDTNNPELKNKFIWNPLINIGKYPIFYNSYENGNPVTFWEVKPKYDQSNMTRLFKISQKWTYEKYKVFVNLIIPEDLFKATFTPKEYLLTPTGKDKKINYKPIRTLNEYLDL